MEITQRVIQRSPEVLESAPVFCGTHVPFQTLVRYLEAGRPLTEVLADFPTGVTKDLLLARID